MKQAILTYLPANHPWKDRILCFDTLDSTNTEAKKLAASGAPHGTVILADTQTGGRGRMGRSFHSPAGSGIYLSVILRPECTASRLMHLTCAVAVAACDAVEDTCGIRPQIKWTNDLVYGKKKLGGILTELSVAPNGEIAYAVIGIGLNCTQQAGDFPPEISKIATSAAMAAGHEVDRCRIAAAIITALEALSGKLLTDRARIMERYRGNCITLGNEISILAAGAVRHGIALDIDETGALTVLFPDGHTEPIAAGEVSIRGMYGYI